MVAFGKWDWRNLTRTFCFVMVGLILLNTILFAMGTFQCSDMKGILNFHVHVFNKTATEI